MEVSEIQLDTACPRCRDTQLSRQHKLSLELGSKLAWAAQSSETKTDQSQGWENEVGTEWVEAEIQSSE